MEGQPSHPLRPAPLSRLTTNGNIIPNVFVLKNLMNNQQPLRLCQFKEKGLRHLQAF